MTTIHTTRHAIELLREAAQNTFAKRYPVAALHGVTRHVKRPCAAIGLARETLIKHESIPAAIEALESQE